MPDSVLVSAKAAAEARKTYRYLRLGIVAMVVFLASSLTIEASKANCLQTSISAYYYTPVRSVFVGTMIAIGLCLIVIKGSTWFEDLFLNIAGMLAPVVAIVPTSEAGHCWSITPNPLPIDSNGALAPWVVANIDGNMKALIYAGLFGLIVAFLIALLANGGPVKLAKNVEPGTHFGLALALAIVVFGWWAFHYWDGFETHAHSYSAIAMFGFLAIAIASNALQRRKDPPKVYFWLYSAIAALMVGSGAVMLALQSHFDHMVFVLEATEITLFAAFWLVQTKELWDDTIRPLTDEPPTTPTPPATAPVEAAAGAR
jgi:hypothetical protein